MSEWERKPFLTKQEWTDMQTPRYGVYSAPPHRAGTPPQQLEPAIIRFVGYWEGSFYVSEHLFKHPGDMMWSGRSSLTWIGAPGWFAYECCQNIYDWLAARYDMTDGWYSGSWMEVNPPCEERESERFSERTRDERGVPLDTLSSGQGGSMCELVHADHA